MLSETSESLLQLLKKKPMTREEIEALGVMTGRELHNLLISLIGGRHLSLSGDGKYSPIPEEIRLARTIKSRAYARAVDVWLTLADGEPHDAMELFKPNGVHHKLCQLLLKSGLCELMPGRAGAVIFVARRERFKSIWDDEVLFCKFFGWPTAHAADVNILLSGRELSLQEQVDITARVAPVIGNSNTARRAGWDFNKVTKLLRLSRLPAAVREHPAIKLRFANELASLPNERAMLDWLEARSSETHEVEEALYEHSNDDEGVLELEPEPDVKEMLATTLKLSAATFDMMSSIERKISWIAKELGWKGD